MRKYLLVILFLSIGFGQDVLTLKKGAIYEGEFLGVKSGKVHFKPLNVSTFKPRRLKEIKELTQDGKVIIQDGKLMVENYEIQSTVTEKVQPLVTQSSPCDDKRYIELKTKSLDEMSDREYQYFYNMINYV